MHDTNSILVRAALCAALVSLTTCRPHAGSVREPASTADGPEAEFRLAADAFYDSYLEANPTRAARLGYHEHDGRLPDMSAEALGARRDMLRAAAAQLEGIDPAGLPSTSRLEHAVLLTTIRGQLFRLETLRMPWRNPMSYMGHLNLVTYIARDYKPREERVRSVIEICTATPRMLEQAHENLEEAIPRTFVETALKQVKGTIPFLRDDVPAALEEPPDTELGKELRAALEEAASALETFQARLEKRLETATDDYALGEEDFLRLLSQTQGIDMDIDTLEEMGRRDLERNLAAIEQAARQIDPDASVGEVVQRVVDDKPTPYGVLEEAEKQAIQMKSFVAFNDIVTIPSDDVAIVRESPPFMRWNAASLDSPGPFEEKPLPSYYHITPPDPEWPEDVQRAYIPGKADLLFITIHELWPGHFLHGLHAKKNPSRILKSFWSYTMGEGWAHYAEEMMWEAGAAGTSPEAHIGQLLNALLRNVRYMSAIGLHARGMSVEESAEMFRSQAFCDEGNATQQAARGTFDPLYLSYTLGKLLILDLREDWKEEKGDAYTLRGFHDAFLSHGAAPIPAIRESMLQ